MNYTKGKWTYFANKQFMEVVCGDSRKKKMMLNIFLYDNGNGMHLSDENRFNAKLISKAPEMYEALKDIVRTNNDTDNPVEVLRKVISNFSKLLNQIENES